MDPFCRGSFFVKDECRGVNPLLHLQQEATQTLYRTLRRTYPESRTTQIQGVYKFFNVVSSLAQREKQRATPVFVLWSL